MTRNDRPRPPRRAIPIRTKREVCARQGGVCPCGCGLRVSEKPRTGTKFDHRPALRLRDVNAEWTDYIPPQHSAEHIDAICAEEHQRRTNGTGATTAGTDTGYIKKERKRSRAPKPKRKWPKRKMKSGNRFPKKKLQRWRNKRCK